MVIFEVLCLILAEGVALQPHHNISYASGLVMPEWWIEVKIQVSVCVIVQYIHTVVQVF